MMEDKRTLIEAELDRLLLQESQDKVTKANKWKPKKLDSLHKKAVKKPEYVLVQYLRNNRRMDFQICKVISGNIVVIDNKGHKLHPQLTFIHGKYTWYIIAEWDTEPIGPRYLSKIKKLQRGTDNHPILMKMVLGAVQKKEDVKTAKNIGWIIGIAAVGLIAWMIFGGK